MSFLDKFRTLFAPKTGEEEADPAENPLVSVAALLVEGALSDGVYARVEEAQIIDVLQRGFGLTETEPREILSAGETEAEKAIGAHQFTKHVKTLSEEKRVAVIEGLYRVALADGDKCPYEDAFVRHVASLLHIEDRPRAEARQRAEAASDTGH